jgi:hypothetical protein
VLSSEQNAVRRDLDCPQSFLLFLLFVASVVALPLCGQTLPRGPVVTLEGALEQLAERVAEIPNLHGPLRVQFFEDQAFAAETGKDWQEAFRNHLEKAHISVTEDAGANLLRVGLAETPTELVLSAGVTVNATEEVRFVTGPRTAFHAANLPVVPVRIEKQLVFQSADRILDAAAFTDGKGSGLLLLAYRGTDLSVIKTDATGASTQFASLAAAGVHTARDLRGEVSAAGSETSVTLPGRICHVGWAAAVDVKCAGAKVAWRTGMVLTPGCESGEWRLTADGADWSAPDLLQVAPDGPGRKGSAALLSDFPGPILSIAAAEVPSAALVVARNLQTGSYEVYKVTLACGN